MQGGAEQHPPSVLPRDDYYQQRQQHRQAGSLDDEGGAHAHTHTHLSDSDRHLRGEPSVGSTALGGSTSSNALPDAFLDDIMTATQVSELRGRWVAAGSPCRTR